MPRPGSTAKPFSGAVARSWTVDLIRIAWSLIAWNARKTRYRLGWSHRCPCQAPGDSGRAGESRCEASFLLDRPTRFRFVCPALRETPAGWRCHHDREKVRPYWGRALGAYLTLALLLWLFATTAWFATLRLSGIHGVAWLDCVWPPRHGHIDEARAAHFRDQFQAAFSRGDISGAIVALHSAFVAADSGWRDGLVLAQIYERTGQFAAADHIFAQVEQQAPEHHAFIAVAQHDAILHSRRYRSLVELAWRELNHAESHRETWLTPLAHALRADPLAINVLPPPGKRTGLSVAERLILQLATQPHRPLAPAERQRLVSTPVDHPAQAILRWRLLLEQGERLAALQAARQDAALLGDFELGLARWATIDPRTPPQQAARWWVELIPLDPDRAHIARLCAVALRSPFAVPLSTLRVRVSDHDRASLAALWVVAVQQGDASLAAELLGNLGFAPRDAALPLQPETLAARLPIVATLLPIPREVLYALMPSPATTRDGSAVDRILTLQE